MSAVFEFFWGFAWGVALTLAVVWEKVRRERARHKWKCPECEFEVEGNQQGLVDYVILEHTADHEK